MTMKSFTTFGACLTALTLAIASGPAVAQQKAPEAAKDAKQVAPVKKTPATKSVCQGVAEAACKANAECRWVGEAKITKGPRAGSTNKAHCAKIPAKKADAKSAAPKAAGK